LAIITWQRTVAFDSVHVGLRTRACMRARVCASVCAVADPGFWTREGKFPKFRPKPPILCNVTVGLHLHEMTEINMKILICESRTPTLGTLSVISLEVDL